MAILGNIIAVILALIIVFSPFILLVLPFVLYYRKKAKKATVNKDVLIQKDVALLNEIQALKQEIEDLKHGLHFEKHTHNINYQQAPDQCRNCTVKINYEKILKESSFK